MNYLFGRSNPSTSVDHQTEDNPSTKNASVDYQTEETEEPNLSIRYWDRGTGKKSEFGVPKPPRGETWLYESKDGMLSMMRLEHGRQVEDKGSVQIPPNSYVSFEFKQFADSDPKSIWNYGWIKVETDDTGYYHGYHYKDGDPFQFDRIEDEIARRAEGQSGQNKDGHTEQEEEDAETAKADSGE